MINRCIIAKSQTSQLSNIAKVAKILALHLRFTLVVIKHPGYPVISEEVLEMAERHNECPRTDLVGYEPRLTKIFSKFRD
jgi:hypothetical protein